MDGRENLLATLKRELDFIDRGGYRCNSGEAWRPKFIFQDSPSCPNFGAQQKTVACTECVLIQLVPADKCDRKFPCRYIPLNESGETIDSFYRSGTPEDLERTLREWLVKSIARLEEERAGRQAARMARGNR